MNKGYKIVGTVIVPIDDTSELFRNWFMRVPDDPKEKEEDIWEDDRYLWVNGSPIWSHFTFHKTDKGIYLVEYIPWNGLERNHSRSPGIREIDGKGILYAKIIFGDE